MPPQPTPPTSTTRTTSTEAAQRALVTWSKDEEEALIAEIREKLKPHPYLVGENNVLEPHQFLHLHHMKTGGTSIDHLLRCGRERLAKDFGSSMQHYSIHECARGMFKRCISDSNDPCRHEMDNAASMSFCSALKHLNLLGWGDNERIKAITMLRHPVERVWSMYRFETKMCYKCKNLTDIYDLLDSGDTPFMDSLCIAQLQNHETANLLTSDWPEDASDDQIVAEAIKNLKSFFTLVGLTEELTLTAQMLGTAFPWLNKTMEGTKTRCSLPHKNSSPDNNHCINNERTDGKPGILTTHWDLPDHPDEKTRKAIEAHNQLDLRVYEAAVQYFELQKRAFEENEEASRR